MHQLDGYVTERSVGEIFCCVGEVAWGESGFAVPQLCGCGRLALDVAFHLAFAEAHVDVVVSVPMHEGFGVWGDFDFKCADIGVCEHEMVEWLGGDFNFLSALSSEHCGR